MSYSLAGKTIAVPTGVFSRNDVDFCTKLLLEGVHPRADDDVCDLGAGSGVVGIFFADRVRSVTLLEANIRSLKSCQANVAANGVRNARVVLSDIFAEFDASFPGETFSLILSNPPTQGGKELVRDFITGARDHLRPGGEFFLACHARLPYEKYCAEIFGDAKVVLRSARAKLVRAVFEAKG